MGADGLEIEPWEEPEGTVERVAPAAPLRAFAPEKLLEDYVRRLQADPGVKRAAAHPGFGHLIAWAADELAHVARTLEDMLEEDARYEMDLVLREVLDRVLRLVSEPVGVAG